MKVTALTGLPIEDIPTAVYRLYDAAGRLLYVGVTDHLRVRLGQHAKDKSWWPEVASRTIAWYGTRQEAEDAETKAIGEEKPIHNKVRRPRPKGPSMTPPGDRHQYRQRYLRPDPATYKRAKEILGAQGSNVNEFLEDCLRQVLAEEAGW
jgi:predicted GIY-YIG superfamily endonuclease